MLGGMTSRLRAGAGAALVASLALGVAGRASPAGPRSRPPYALDLPLAPARFVWSSPLAQRNDLFAVKGTPDGSRIWAVGAAGTVLSLRGANATVEVTGSDVDLYDVWVVAANDVWVVGDRGTILHWDGKRWSRGRSGTKEALYSIWARDAHELWIGGDAGVILRREGDSWRAMPAGTRGPIAGIVGCDGDAVCALTLANLLPRIDTSNRPCDDPEGCTADEDAEPEGDRLLRWSPSNERWSTVPLQNGLETRRMAAARTTLWLPDSNLLRIVRGGKLDELPVNLPKDTERVLVTGLWARDDKDGWLVGERWTEERPGGDYKTTGGAIWRFDGRAATLRKEVPPTALTAVWSWSKNGAIAVGERGTIMRFDGTAWTAVSQPATTGDLRGVWSTAAAADPKQAAAIALRARDNDDQPQPRTVDLTAGNGMTLGWGLPKQRPASAAAGAETWLFGDCEALRARDRAWVTYFPASCDPHAPTRTIFGIGGDLWSTGGAYGPLHWSGQSWTSIRSASGSSTDLWAANSDDVWFIGGRDVVHWDGKGLGPRPAVPGLAATDALGSIWGSDAKDVWVAAHGRGSVKVARWDGEQWVDSATFRFDLPRRYFPTESWAASNLWPARFAQSESVTLWGTAADDVWLAGPNGIVIHYDGRRWLRVPTPTRHPLFGLGGTRDRVYAVGSSGTILQLEARSPARAATK